MKKKSKNQNKKKVVQKTGFLTESDVSLLRDQIKKNSGTIDRYIQIIDLLINKEQCPKDANNYRVKSTTLGLECYGGRPSYRIVTNVTRPSAAVLMIPAFGP